MRNTWNDGIKQVCKEIAEKKAQQADINWMNDPENVDKWNEAIASHEIVELYR